jgi:hypothetical protein
MLFKTQVWVVLEVFRIRGERTHEVSNLALRITLSPRTCTDRNVRHVLLTFHFPPSRLCAPQHPSHAKPNEQKDSFLKGKRRQRQLRRAFPRNGGNTYKLKVSSHRVNGTAVLARTKRAMAGPERLTVGSQEEPSHSSANIPPSVRSDPTGAQPPAARSEGEWSNFFPTGWA